MPDRCNHPASTLGAGCALTTGHTGPHVSELGNTVQGSTLRNGKGRSKYPDWIGNIIAKYGTPYDLHDHTA